MMKNAKRTLAVILGLSFLGMGIASAMDPMVEKATLERIKPVGTVNTGGAVVIASGSRSGKEIVEATCAGCHASGALGAPKIGVKADWKGRGSLAAMTKSAAKGKGAMPPKGGDSSLSNKELKDAIAYMTK
ncbi:MAG: cytochrome c5 family protein [Gammaproteobacteria bacterium]|nr:cytochrome c5 family protein [Gammaproteobacteria bacterium]